MDAIYIPNLTQALQQTETIQIQDYLPDLETLTPVQGQLQVTHRGNFLEVKTQAETIVTLSCDRCLQQYNHRLVVNASEIIWLEEKLDELDEEGSEREIAFDDLVETLDPKGYFYPNDWLYQQFCLALPQRQLCDLQCQGIQIDNSPSPPSGSSDRRWASLEALKGHFPTDP